MNQTVERSRIERLPAEVISGIAERCEGEDLRQLARTNRAMKRVTRSEVDKVPVHLEITGGRGYAEGVWRKVGMGKRSVVIRVEVGGSGEGYGMEDGPGLPASLRVVHLIRERYMARCSIFHEILKSLPERCGGLAELEIRTHAESLGTCHDEGLGRLKRLRRLSISAIGDGESGMRLQSLPRSLRSLELLRPGWLTAEEVEGSIARLPLLEEVSVWDQREGSCAWVLRGLARMGARHLGRLTIGEGAGMPPSPGPPSIATVGLTEGLEGLVRLQPPLVDVHLGSIAGWSSPTHLRQVHGACGSSIRTLSLFSLPECLFPAGAVWGGLEMLSLMNTGVLGVVGEMEGAIFPVLHTLSLSGITGCRGLAQGDGMFPRLHTLTMAGSVDVEASQAVVEHALDDLRCIYLSDPTLRCHLEALAPIPIRRARLIDYNELSFGRKGGDDPFARFTNIEEVLL